MPDLEIGFGLPPSLIWAVVTAMSVILLICTSFMYFWYRSRVNAIVDDSQDVADFAAKKIILESEIEQCQTYLDNQREELLRIEAERRHQEELRQDLANLSTQVAEHSQKVEESRKEATDLQNVVSALAQDREKLKNETELLEQKRNEAQTAQNEFEGVKQRFEEEKLKFEMLLQNIAQNEVKQQSIIGDIAAREMLLAKVKKDLELTEESLNKAKTDHATLKEVLAEKERARKDRDDYIAEKQKHVVEKQELMEKVAQLKRDEIRLSEKVSHLRDETGIEGDVKFQYTDLLDIAPKCLDESIFPNGPIAERGEQIALEGVKDHLRQKGFIFSERTVNSFHTCLKIGGINPLTVLAGISGTGKTLLPMQYAEAMGMHCLITSVQPGWDSPSDLLGFYNYLEKKYKATDIARALIRMDKYNFSPDTFKQLRNAKRSDRMLIVLLDEMNLARVEYYFSEFLSKLELRRDIGDPSLASARSKSEILLDVGPASKQDEQFRVWVGDNVLFVGTMNEDESTQTLSDKVLDRANVLRFGRPSTNADTNHVNGNKIHLSDKFLKLKQWQAWIVPPKQSSQYDSLIAGWTQQANDALESIGRPFGHRVQQSMRDYVLNYPGLDERSCKDAFADQVEQKILPKLRGLDMLEANSRQALEAVDNIIEKLGDDALLSAYRQCKDDQSTGTFVWRGVKRQLNKNVVLPNN